MRSRVIIACHLTAEVQIRREHLLVATDVCPFDVASLIALSLTIVLEALVLLAKVARRLLSMYRNQIVICCS